MASISPHISAISSCIAANAGRLFIDKIASDSIIHLARGIIHMEEKGGLSLRFLDLPEQIPGWNASPTICGGAGIGLRGSYSGLWTFKLGSTAAKTP